MHRTEHTRTNLRAGARFDVLVLIECESIEPWWTGLLAHMLLSHAVRYCRIARKSGFKTRIVPSEERAS